MKNKKTIILLLVLSLVLVTLGTTMAIFTYRALGSTESTITTGGITFHYKEMNGKGRGIAITDALPVSSNNDAKSSNDYFDFKITSSVTNGAVIPYVVTARMDPDSDAILGDIVDIYLTEVNGNSEEPTTLFKTDIPVYNALEQYSNVTGYTEKIIYADRVTTSSYEKNFRLRMWIDENTNLNTGNGQSAYNDKQFSITVNVNAMGQLAASINSCKEVNGTYYGTDGTEVDAATYITQCRNQEYYCQSVNGIYYGSDGNPTDAATYETQCGSDPCMCQIVNGDYFGKNGSTVEEPDYITQCTKPKGKTPEEDLIDEDDPNENECTTVGYYGLQCSCDNRWISWSDGDNYLDVFGKGMDKYRTLDPNYPQANAYSCSCGSETGYVVNTGKFFGKNCEDQSGTERLNTMIMADNTLKTSTVDLNTRVPGISSYVDNGFKARVYNRAMSGSSLNYYFLYSDSYSFDEATGKYTLTGTIGSCKYSDSGCVDTLKGKYTNNYSGKSNNSFYESSYTNVDYIYKIHSDTTDSKLYYQTPADKSINYDLSDSGLYSLTLNSQGFGGTTDGGTTYYFRGAVNNNYVEFGTWKTPEYRYYASGLSQPTNFMSYTSMEDCQTTNPYNPENCYKAHEVGDPIVWRVVRINEDQTVRLVLDEALRDDYNIEYNTDGSDYTKMYFSNSTLKPILDNWYASTITGKDATKVATGNYFCEQAKVKYYSYEESGSATMAERSSYTPTLTCATDGNDKGLVNTNVGLLTYEEIAYAGYNHQGGGLFNEQFYIWENVHGATWTMSPGGFSGNAYNWVFGSGGYYHVYVNGQNEYLRPVINLKADTMAIKDTTTGHYIVK